jgi:hypothetical protein
MSGYEDDCSGGAGAVWADEAELTLKLPPMRTFRVIISTPSPYGDRYTLYVDAHSVTCEGDAAKFYVYRVDSVSGTPVLAAYSTRTLRPYLDVEDVTAEVAATGKLLN